MGIKTLSKYYDVIIVGAGAAGMMCAMQAGQRGRSVLLLDKADKAGRKILISGGGRCNFTNMYTEPACYLSANPHFCKSALARYTPWDFMALMEKHALSWHEKTLGQLFCDQKAPAVVNMLLQECDAVGVTLQLQSGVADVSKLDSGFRLQLESGQAVQCESLVVATGGPSIPRMGSTDYGLQLAKQFKLKNIPFVPALVPFTLPNEQLNGFCKDLSGLAVFVEVSVNGVSFKENMLFTHRGLSGPAMLQASSYWYKGDAVHINILPDRDVFDWLLEQQQQRPKSELKTILMDALPKRLVLRLGEQLIPNKPMQHLHDVDLQQIAKQLSDWVWHPAGTEGMRTAEVCTGGVDTQELSSKTMMAQKVPGLYFIGEVVDVTGWLGGYNFQWAWASGWCAGEVV